MPAFTGVYVNAQHEPNGPVLAGDVLDDPAPFLPDEELSVGHMTTMRGHALIAAMRKGQPVLIMAAGKPRLLVTPDGSYAKPPGTTSGDARTGDCRAGQGEGACFCPNCRAARRATR